MQIATVFRTVYAEYTNSWNSIEFANNSSHSLRLTMWASTRHLYIIQSKSKWWKIECLWKEKVRNELIHMDVYTKTHFSIILHIPSFTVQQWKMWCSDDRKVFAHSEYCRYRLLTIEKLRHLTFRRLLNRPSRWRCNGCRISVEIWLISI